MKISDKFVWLFGYGWAVYACYTLHMRFHDIEWDTMGIIMAVVFAVVVAVGTRKILANFIEFCILAYHHHRRRKIMKRYQKWLM